MEQNIRLDVNNMMADMLGGEYGVTQAQLARCRMRCREGAAARG